MSTNRIVPNIEGENLAAADEFYGKILGLDLLMDLGWVRTYGSSAKMNIQVSIATEGGSGTPVPDISIEVDDLDAILEKVRAANHPIEYGPTLEPWGVRRFYVRDPFGKLINILQHDRSSP